MWSNRKAPMSLNLPTPHVVLPLQGHPPVSAIYKKEAHRWSFLLGKEGKKGKQLAEGSETGTSLRRDTSMAVKLAKERGLRGFGQPA